MSGIAKQATGSKDLVLDFLEELRHGRIDEALMHFANSFKFWDHGIGLEFIDRWRLAEFFRKSRALYPDSVEQINTIVEDGDRVSMEWTLRTSLEQAYYVGEIGKLTITLRGVRVVEVEDGKIKHWSEYYDGLTARRAELSQFFTEWFEL
jgi:steroid delta-isomerase-like uncharacterized protein